MKYFLKVHGKDLYYQRSQLVYFADPRRSVDFYTKYPHEGCARKFNSIQSARRVAKSLDRGTKPISTAFVPARPANGSLRFALTEPPDALLNFRV